MHGFNNYTAAGNLTRDPELRYTAKGTAVAQFTLAMNRSWTSEDGEKKEKCTFIDFKAWGRNAENIGQYMRKGRPMLVNGYLDVEEWDDKQTGEKKRKVICIVHTCLFLGSSPDGDGQGQGRQPAARAPQQSRSQRTAAAAASSGGEPLEGDGPPESDDVPF